MEFDRHPDRVVATAARLVNALTPGQARGRPYVVDDLAATARDAVAGTRSARTERFGPEAASDLAALAAELRAVFEAVAAGDVDTAATTLNQLLRSHHATPELARHDGESWHLHFHSQRAGLAEGLGAGCATALAMVLGSDEADRLGVCSADACDRVYLDTTRNGSRRFCSTACQNRVKAAAFRARHRDD